MSMFEITYRLTVQADEAVDEKVDTMCLEQTAELPRSVLGAEIEEKVVGKVLNIEEYKSNHYQVKIGWPLADIGDDISQFLNILYGNISLQPGIIVAGAYWSALSPKVFQGPEVGIKGIRNRYEISDRPLSATALKPLGSSPAELADLCYQFAQGGIDLIKDDHGLANQDFAPFEERVEACVAAIRQSAQNSGRRSYYYPNITAFASHAIDRYEKAAELGADGVLLCPHITGLETMHRLARMDINLPIMAHPAFSGSLTTNKKQGLSPDFLYGQLWRALGADFVIYPNQGGRFSFTPAQCQAINASACNDDIPFKVSFPTPAGGIKIESLEKWIASYGTDITFLIGGSLYEHPEGVEAASKEFVRKLSQS